MCAMNRMESYISVWNAKVGSNVKSLFFFFFKFWKHDIRLFMFFRIDNYALTYGET